MKQFRISLRTLGAVALLVCSAVTHANSGGEIDQTLAVAKEGQVRFKSLDAEVEFVGWDKNTVQVTGRLRDSKEELIFKNDGADTVIQIETDRSGFDGYHRGGSQAKLKIFMPANTQLFAQSTSGDFAMSGLKAGIRAKNISGDIDITDSAGRIEAYSSSGDIAVLRSQGEILVETVSGELEAIIDAKRFSASTISGDIDALLTNSERIRMSSVSGNVVAVLEIAEQGAVEVSTVSGNIELAFKQAKLNAHFDITTGPGGDIDNRITEDEASQSWIESEMLEFRVGDGSAQIELETVSGSIRVDRRAP